jgi:hypothetical protein
MTANNALQPWGNMNEGSGFINAMTTHRWVQFEPTKSRHRYTSETFSQFQRAGINIVRTEPCQEEARRQAITVEKKRHLRYGQRHGPN